MNTTELITGGTTEEEFPFPVVEESKLKRRQRITAGLTRTRCVWCFCVWQP